MPILAEIFRRQKMILLGSVPQDDSIFSNLPCYPDSVSIAKEHPLDFLKDSLFIIHFKSEQIAKEEFEKLSVYGIGAEQILFLGSEGKNFPCESVFDLSKKADRETIRRQLENVFSRLRMRIFTNVKKKLMDGIQVEDRQSAIQALLFSHALCVKLEFDLIAYRRVLEKHLSTECKDTSLESCIHAASVLVSRDRDRSELLRAKLREMGANMHFKERTDLRNAWTSCLYPWLKGDKNVA